MQIGEWIETFWDCYNNTGFLCVPFYLAANLGASLILAIIMIGIVVSSLMEMKRSSEDDDDEGLRGALRKICKKIPFTCSNTRSEHQLLSDQRNESFPGNVSNGGGIRNRGEGSLGENQNAQISTIRKILEHKLYNFSVCLVIILASIAMVNMRNLKNVNE